MFRMTKAKHKVELEVSAAQAQEVFGVSRQALSSWVKAGMPKRGPGRYEVCECFRWLLQRERDRHASGTLAEERCGLIAAQRRLKERELEVISGQFVRVDEISQLIALAVNAFRSRMLSVPNIAPRVLACREAGEVQTLLRDAVHDALSELAALEFDSKQFQALCKGVTL